MKANERNQKAASQSLAITIIIILTV